MRRCLLSGSRAGARLDRSGRVPAVRCQEAGSPLGGTDRSAGGRCGVIVGEAGSLRTRLGRAAGAEEAFPGVHLLAVQVAHGADPTAQDPPHGRAEAAGPLAGCHHDHLDVSWWPASQAMS